MKVSFFIDRPVFSAVISILIVIVGIIGLMMLPIDQYPQITPPVVKISASYPGASAVTVSQAVATPIEQELNGTPGMLYMESSSSNSGGFSATVTFDISADPDLAAVEIQNRIKLAESFSWPIKTCNLKRCMLETRIPIEGTDKELVLINFHLEAYDLSLIHI